MKYPPDTDQGETVWDFIIDAAKSLGIAAAGAAAAVLIASAGLQAWGLL